MLELFRMLESQLMRRLSFLLLVLCVLVSFKNQNAETRRGSPAAITFSSPDPVVLSDKIGRRRLDTPGSLQYDFYRDSCPRAEEVIASRMRELYRIQPDVAPALLRLVFHDCFIGGCDASVLLDADGIESEKDSPPNASLKGFDLIELLKAEIEEECPGIVSCADILVMAARDGVLLSGGPYYPLYTGRKDSTQSFPDIATYELPSPRDDLSQTLSSFATRGFTERETVAILGAHSIGTIHCKFFRSRLYNFDGTDEPDPSIDVNFLKVMREKCNDSHLLSSPDPSPSAASPSFYNLLSSSMDEPGMEMDYNGRGLGFGMLYYRGLMQGRGILYADQQLMAGKDSASWVKIYATDASLFHEDFALVMMKLSNLGVLTSPMGQLRKNCSKVA